MRGQPTFLCTPSLSPYLGFTVYENGTTIQSSGVYLSTSTVICKYRHDVNLNLHGEAIEYLANGTIFRNYYEVNGEIVIDLMGENLDDVEKFEIQMMYGGSWL